jgi:type I restriction enzyme, S subunit
MEVKPGYKQSEVGVLPEDWEGVAIGSKIDLLTGFPFPSSGYTRTGVRLLRGSNVKRGVTDWSEDGTQHWPAITSDIRKYVLKAGDVVIAMDGSLVGRSFAMLSENDMPALLLQRVARIRSEDIAQGYLKAWICSKRFTEHSDAVKTVTAIPHISPADIRSFRVALPPTKAEQEAIAEALSDADALIEAHEHLLAKKRQLKQGAMQELLTGRKRLPGFSGEWEVKRLGDLGSFLKGSGVTKDEAQSGDLACVRYGEIYTRHSDYIATFHSWISPDVAAAATRLKQGDILFAGSGETKEEIGKCAAFVGALEAYAGGDIVILRVEEGDPLFLGYYLNTEPINRQKASKGQGDAVVHIGAGALASVHVSVPSASEQTAIAAILSDMDAELTALEAKLAKARQLKQGMMRELLTGRIRLV